VLLHGLSGDERSLWVFEPALPRDGMILAVRGVYPWPPGGYSWIAPDVDRRYAAQDFAAGIEAVVTAMEARLPGEVLQQGVVLVGFSQGTGLSFALAATRRVKVSGIVCLSGFLPDGVIEVDPGIRVFWSHGVHDPLVPIDEARVDVARLRRAGVQVTLCEAETGHKVGLECVHRLRTWLVEEGLA
jgi:predicted esterase